MCIDCVCVGGNGFEWKHINRLCIDCVYRLCVCVGVSEGTGLNENISIDCVTLIENILENQEYGFE